MVISRVDLGAEALGEDSAVGIQVVEEQMAPHLEHTAESPTEAVEEIVEESVAHI